MIDEILDINQLISKKSSKYNYSKTEIDYIVNSYTNEDIPDDKMTLWLKKIFKHGMSFKETILYTNSIIPKIVIVVKNYFCMVIF